MMKSDRVVVLPTLYKRTSGGGVQVWNMTILPHNDDAGILHVEYGLQGGKQQVQEETIHKGKNAGKKNATTGYQQAVAEGKARWEKQLTRKGYGETVEASAATRAISPMLAHPYDKKTGKIDWTTAYAQPKFDGFRLLATCTADGKVTLRSREGKPMPALIHIVEYLEKNPPIDEGEPLILDGEAYCHGFSLPQISSACKKAGELTPRIRYHVYDVVLPNASFEDRHLYIQDLFEDDTIVKTVKTVKVRSEADLMRCQAEFVGEGYEGAMLRYGNVGYEAGKRSSHLLKVKTFQDDEFVVVDYKFGRGKYEKTPIFVCETEAGHNFDVTAPGTMEEKEILGAYAAQCVGQMLTVKYQYLTKTGEPVPFLPVAKCFPNFTPV